MKNFDLDFLPEILESNLLKFLRVTERWIIFFIPEASNTLPVIALIKEQIGVQCYMRSVFFVRRSDGAWSFLDPDVPEVRDNHLFYGTLTEEYEDFWDFIARERGVQMALARFLLRRGFSDILPEGVTYMPDDPDICFIAKEDDLAELIRDDTLRHAVRDIYDGDLPSFYSELSLDHASYWMDDGNDEIYDTVRDTLSELEDQDLDPDVLETKQRHLQDIINSATENGLRAGYERKVLEIFHDDLKDNGWTLDPENGNFWEIRWTAPVAIMNYELYLKGEYEFPLLEETYPVRGIDEFDEEAFNERIRDGELQALLEELQKLLQKLKAEQN